MEAGEAHAVLRRGRLGPLTENVNRGPLPATDPEQRQPS